MKIIRILFFLFALQCTQHTFAQYSLFPEGRKWYVMSKLLNPFTSVDINSIVACGDTLIDGKSYTYLDREGYIRKDGTRIYAEMFDGCDSLVFDESWEVGDTTTWFLESVFNEDSLKFLPKYEKVINIRYINGLKCWDMDLDGWYCSWLQGVGYISGGRDVFEVFNTNVGKPSYDLICCVEANGDTLYVNRDLMYMLETSIENISFDAVSYKIFDDKIVIILPTDVSSFSVALYNSNGIKIARKSGSGSEIVLPTTYTGTHILVIEADGKMIEKKIFVK